MNCYLNYLGIDRKKPKQKLQNTNLEELRNELEESGQREKLMGDRLRRQQENTAELKNQLTGVEAEVGEMRRLVSKLATPT